MRLEEYTPETICRAMGLPSFSEDDSLRKRGEALRVLFMPSFDPELAVTLWEDESGVFIQVVTLQQMLWRERLWARMPDISATTAISVPDFRGLIDDFHKARLSLETEPHGGAIDGMSVAVCHYSAGLTDVFDVHTSTTEAVRQFSTRVVEVAWAATTDYRILNAIAHVAGYVGIDYPLVELPPGTPITRLLIFGTPDAREDYFKQLGLQQKGQS